MNIIVFVKIKASVKRTYLLSPNQYSVGSEQDILLFVKRPKYIAQRNISFKRIGD